MSAAQAPQMERPGRRRPRGWGEETKKNRHAESVASKISFCRQKNSVFVFIRRKGKEGGEGIGDLTDYEERTEQSKPHGKIMCMCTDVCVCVYGSAYLQSMDFQREPQSKHHLYFLD